MSFIRDRRLFRNELKASMMAGYVLDLLALAVIWMVVSVSIPETERFSSRTTTVVAPPSAIALIGFLFFYGVRLSTYVAMIRRNRAPQVIEWWCMLIGLIVPLSVYPLDDVLLRLYAHVSGYALCHTVATKPLVEDLFVLRGHACPAP